jgi:hypothetical protein
MAQPVSQPAVYANGLIYHSADTPHLFQTDLLIIIPLILSYIKKNSDLIFKMLRCTKPWTDYIRDTDRICFNISLLNPFISFTIALLARINRPVSQ